jgi:hypothetical protein
MYGLTRGVLTLIAVVAAGFLLWLSAAINDLGEDGDLTQGQFWAALGLWAAAGLVMALSQLLGGWTKWGLPRVSGNVFLLGFLPALILGGWVLTTGEPGEHWLGRHVRDWSDDIALEDLVNELRLSSSAIAFGIGLVFGFTFDTTGPRVRREPAAPVPPVAAEEQQTKADESTDDRRVHIREGGAPTEPEPEPAPRSGGPPPEE